MANEYNVSEARLEVLMTGVADLWVSEVRLEMLISVDPAPAVSGRRRNFANFTP